MLCTHRLTTPGSSEGLSHRPHGLCLSALALAALLAFVAGCSDPGYVGPDTGPAEDSGPRPDVAPLCQGNNDGVIGQSEMPMVSGITVDYLVNAPGTVVTVAPGGQPRGDGTVEWDFSDVAGQVFSVTLGSVWGSWYESSFPTAHYAAALGPGNDTLGIYRAADGAVWMLGFASPDADRTLAVYDSPVPLIRFPVSVGQSWAVVGRITDATYDHQPFAATDTYSLSVDQRGTLVLPYLSLHNTLRLKVELHTSLPGGQTLHRIQYLYLHECYGELGRIVSQDGELDPGFTQAAEFRRLALP